MAAQRCNVISVLYYQNAPEEAAFFRVDYYGTESDEFHVTEQLVEGCEDRISLESFLGRRGNKPGDVLSLALGLEARTPWQNVFEISDDRRKGLQTVADEHNKKNYTPSD